MNPARTLTAYLAVVFLACVLFVAPIEPAATAARQNQSVPSPQRAQSSADGAKLAFDAASIKEWHSGYHPSGPISPDLARTPGRIFSNCTSVKVLVFYAYHLTYAVPLSGLPSWAEAPCGGDGPGTYVVEATMPPETTDEQARQMMQNLLAERFNFAAHWTTKEMPVLALVVGPGGFKLRPANPNADDSSKPHPRIGCPDDDRACHWIGGGTGHISDLASMLSVSLGRPVIDRSQVDGEYNIDIMWASDTVEASSLPSLTTALKEKFGLELKSQTAPVKCLVVDHVEKPSDN